MSPRHADQLSRFFAELPVTADTGAKCIRVQCLYCNEIKAKNTTRQKQHLANCKPYLLAHPEAALDADADGDDADGDGDGPTGLSMGADQYNPALGMGGTTNVQFAPNPRINGNQPGVGSAEGPPRKKQKAAVKQPKKSQTVADANDIPLATIHAAFEEFPAKPGDKCATVRCRYCGQQRAKNTSRQREHLRACNDYQAVNPTPAAPVVPTAPMTQQPNGVNNNVEHLRNLQTPQLSFDFKLMAYFTPPESHNAPHGDEQVYTMSKGKWTGRMGSGQVQAGRVTTFTRQGSVQRYVEGDFWLRTSDAVPITLPCTIRGNITGENARVTLTFGTTHPNYEFLNYTSFIAIGFHRGHEVVYEAYRVG
ncbi:hypothetical protein V8F20_005400 [Naviculisporaceae sp. PSN 640]